MAGDNDRVVVHVSTTEVRESALHVSELPDTCCGLPVEHGFGLAGGGFGPYVCCAGECGRMYKNQSEEESE